MTKYFYRRFQVVIISACLISCSIFHVLRPSKIDYNKNFVKKATIWTSRSNKDGTEENNYHFNYHENLKFFDTVRNQDASGYIKDSVMKEKTKYRWIYRLNFVVSIILQMFVSMNFGYSIDNSFFSSFKVLRVNGCALLTAINKHPKRRANMLFKMGEKLNSCLWKKKKNSESRTYEVDCILFF